jgi:hypothetical protein
MVDDRLVIDVDFSMTRPIFDSNRAFQGYGVAMSMSLADYKNGGFGVWR